MIKTINKYLVSKWRTVAFAIMSLVLYYAISFFLHPDDLYWKAMLTRPTEEIIIDMSLSFVFCLAISQISITINARLNKVLPWTEKTIQRALVQTFWQIFFISLFIAFQIGIAIIIYGTECDDDVLCGFAGFWNWITASIAISLVISTINTGSFFIENWKKTALDASEHKLMAAEHQRAATEAELQALKLQIDPHFVFNNLSVLSELILKDQQLGYDYSENFSKVYRYLLVNSKKDIIPLSEELKFLKSYIFLIQNRVGNGVSFSIDIDKKAGQLGLPPLTLQFLIENALKHNKAVKSKPLKIKIYSMNPETIIVENLLYPMETPVSSSGIGLSNIVRRYKLLSDKVPLIVKDNNTFKVIIPLIDFKDEYSNH